MPRTLGEVISLFGSPEPDGYRAVTRGVVGNESTGVTFSVSAAARQPASSSLLGPTSFVSAPSLSVSKSFAIEPSER